MSKKNMTEERLALASRLRDVRKKLNYTQEKFAEILEISITTYKKIESAENQITLDEMRRLNRKLNVSADYLLFGEYADYEKTWENIQNCVDADKMRLMLRLMAYFVNEKGDKYLSKEALDDIDTMIKGVTIDKNAR